MERARERATTTAGWWSARLPWRKLLLGGAGLGAALAVVACGQGGSHTQASGVYFTAVPTAAYNSGPGTPHSVPPGTPAGLLATPGGTPSATRTSAPGGTPVATPGHP